MTNVIVYFLLYFPRFFYLSYDTHCRLACVMFNVLVLLCLKIPAKQACKWLQQPWALALDGVYLCGHPWNGLWWSAPWCHLHVAWAMWPVPPVRPCRPGSDREAWSHSQPGSAGMCGAPLAPQRRPGNMTLKRERWTDLFLYPVWWLDCNMLLKLLVIAIPGH